MTKIIYQIASILFFFLGAFFPIINKILVKYQIGFQDDLAIELTMFICLCVGAALLDKIPNSTIGDKDA